MTAAHPIDWATLIDYWAGDLAQEELESLEEHLMGCQACSALSERAAALTETLRAQIPPLLTPEQRDSYAARGLRIVDNPMQPGERREVSFPANADILLHRLTGLELSRAHRVGFALLTEADGQVVVQVDEASFDRERGELLVACQRHYAVMPPDLVAEVRVVDDDGSEHVTSYTLLHRY